jgi:hypothetical protein
MCLGQNLELFMKFNFQPTASKLQSSMNKFQVPSSNGPEQRVMSGVVVAPVLREVPSGEDLAPVVVACCP